MKASTINPADTPPPQDRKSRRSGHVRARKAGNGTWPFIAFLAPALLLLIVTRVWPMVDAFITSLDLDSGDLWRNYADMFASSSFRGALTTTLIFCVLINPIQVVLSLILALYLTERVPGAGLHRTIILIPIAVPQAVSAIVWGIWFRPDDGLVNGILTSLGLPAQPFLTSPDQALIVIMLIVTWIGVGYWMTFLVAGIKEVPTEIIEAASIDGAGWVRTQLSIVVPMIRRQLSFVLVAATVANFLLFVPVQVLTNGGPSGSTNLIMFEAYQTAFSFNDLPLAMAEISLLFIIMLIIVSIQFGLMRDRKEVR